MGVKELLDQKKSDLENLKKQKATIEEEIQQIQAEIEALRKIGELMDRVPSLKNHIMVNDTGGGA